MNDKVKAQKLIGMTLAIARLKSDLEDFSRFDPEFKQKLSMFVKALDAIDAVVETSSMKLGVDPEEG